MDELIFLLPIILISFFLITQISSFFKKTLLDFLKKSLNMWIFNESGRKTEFK